MSNTEYPTNNNTIHNKQGRLCVYQDNRTKRCHAVLDDGILVDPSDPYKARTPIILAAGSGASLAEALCNLTAI